MASGASVVRALLLIEPVVRTLKTFEEQLINHLDWQAVVDLIEQGNIEEAEAQAKAIRDTQDPIEELSGHERGPDGYLEPYSDDETRNLVAWNARHVARKRPRMVQEVPPWGSLALYFPRKREEGSMGPSLYWTVTTPAGGVIAAGQMERDLEWEMENRLDGNRQVYWVSQGAFVLPEHQRQGMYSTILREIRRLTGCPLLPDVLLTRGSSAVWKKLAIEFGLDPAEVLPCPEPGVEKSQHDTIIQAILWLLEKTCTPCSSQEIAGRIQYDETLVALALGDLVVGQKVLQTHKTNSQGTPLYVRHLLRSQNDAKGRAYQLIQPKELGMSDFAERLFTRPTWQLVVDLIQQGRDEEARQHADAIRTNGENN